MITNFMSDAEFNEIVAEARAYKERTSFPAIDPRDDYESSGHHAEFAASAH